MSKVIFKFVLVLLIAVPLSLASTMESLDTAPAEAVSVESGNGYTPPGLDLVTWSTGANMPTARYSSVTGWWDGVLYVAHGRMSNSAPYNTNVCEAYDPVLNSWTTMTPAPTARRMVGMGQVQVGNILYSVGGRAEPSSTVGTLEAYDMSSDTWTTLAPCSPRWAHGAAADGEYLYVFGSSSYTSSAQKYDPATNQWTNIAPLPTGNGWVAGASLNGLVYCIGGATGVGNLCYEYDPATNIWSQKASMPAARKYHVALGDPATGKIYVFGGEVGGSSTASVVSFDPAANFWMDEGDMPATRIWVGAGGNSLDELYVLGGSSVTSPANYQNNTWIGSTEIIVYDVVVTLTPVNPPIQIPASGGSFDFNIEMVNNDPATALFQAWAMVTLPSGASFGPVVGPFTLTLSPGGSIERDRIQYVPERAASGNYIYEGYVGWYPDDIFDEDSFPFEKLAISDGGAIVHDWANWGEAFPGEVVGTPMATPSEYSLLGTCPNPFNPSTTISYYLPQAGNVSLVVYDINGRQVKTLVDGWMSAGTHEANFYAGHLASGVYFYNLTTGGFTETKKMILVK